MNAAAIVRAAIPGATDDVVSLVVWGMTPFPFEVSPRLIYRAASRLVRAGRNGITLCDHCPNRTVPGEYCCESCNRILRAHR